MSQVSDSQNNLDLLFSVISDIIRKEGNNKQFCKQFLTPEVEKYMKNGETLLSIAIMNYNEHIVQLLVERQNSSLEILNDNNDTILHLLGGFWDDNYQELTTSLLNKSDLLMRTNKRNETFLHSRNISFLNFVLNDDHVTKELIDMCGDINGHTCLFSLVQFANGVTGLKKCIEKGANIHIKNKKGHTIIEHAERFNVREILKYLNPLFKQDLNIYDHVRCISNNNTGVIISNVIPQNDCVTVAFNQPGLIQNILKSDLQNLPKELTLTQGSFIYNFDLITDGLLVTDVKQNRLIVSSKNDTSFTITNLDDNQNLSVSKQYFSRGKLFWIA